MKLSLILASAGVAVAQTGTAYSTASSIILAIASDTANLDTAVKAYQAGDGPQIKQLAQDVLDETNSGDAQVKQLGNFPLLDAANLAFPLNSLVTSVSAVVTDLLAAKATIVADCQGPAVLTGLQQQILAANTLGADLATRVTDAALQPIATSYSSQISAYLQSAIDGYADETALSGTCITTTSTTTTTTTSTTSSTSSSTTTTESSTSTTTGQSSDCTASTTVVESDAVSSISTFLDVIATDLAALDQGVVNFGGPCDADKLQDLTQAVLDELEKDAPAFCSFPTLSDDDVTGTLLTPIFNLATAVNQTISDLVSKKQDFVDACLGPQVLQDLKDQLDATVDFSSGLVDVTPDDLQIAATQISTSITAYITSGISAFMDQTATPDSCSTVTCTNGGGGDVSTTTTTTTSQTSSSTSSPTSSPTGGSGSGGSGSGGSGSGGSGSGGSGSGGSGSGGSGSGGSGSGGSGSGGSGSGGSGSGGSGSGSGGSGSGSGGSGSGSSGSGSGSSGSGSSGSGDSGSSGSGGSGSSGSGGSGSSGSGGSASGDSGSGGSGSGSGDSGSGSGSGGSQPGGSESGNSGSGSGVATGGAVSGSLISLSVLAASFLTAVMML